MLVLSRREGESIVIRDDIEVFVLEVHGNRVKLGFEAKPEDTIVRSELIDHESDEHE